MSPTLLERSDATFQRMENGWVCGTDRKRIANWNVTLSFLFALWDPFLSFIQRVGTLLLVCVISEGPRIPACISSPLSVCAGEHVSIDL